MKRHTSELVLVDALRDAVQQYARHPFTGHNELTSFDTHLALATALNVRMLRVFQSCCKQVLINAVNSLARSIHQQLFCQPLTFVSSGSALALHSAIGRDGRRHACLRGWANVATRDTASVRVAVCYHQNSSDV